ncbi:MAG: DUF1015 family protein [Candidatus Wallbacteria bacterium]|nr:DUF1015 family protein [Candidatus Wallbacteria bacterium]
MSVLKPFRGLRPARELVSKVAVLPYDVLSSDEARQKASGNPISFFHVTKPEIDLDPGINLYSDIVYETGKNNFLRLIKEGVFVQDKEEYLYIYRQKMGAHAQTGILGCASVDDYSKDIIKKHELTRKDKEDDRTRHVREMDANAGPVFLTYRAEREIDAVVDEFVRKNSPEYDFTAEDGIEHVLWVIRDKSVIRSLSGLFAEKVPVLYVADGHHRAASAARVGMEKRQKTPDYSGHEEFNFFLAVYFPHDQLKILDYNRVVKDLNGLTPDVFMAEIGKKFRLENLPAGREPFRPDQPHTFGMFLEGSWHKLTAIEGNWKNDDPVESLDVSILLTNLLDPILGIRDPRTDKRIDFIGGIRGTGELVKVVNEGHFKVAFAMYPTTLEELMRIANAGKLMPPKSTWFEPKLRSGLVIHLLT